MGGANRRFSFAGGGYAYQPTGGLERLENVRIPIWSTKAVTARWFGPAGPLVDADLRPVGTDRLAGTVTNRQSLPARRRDPGLRQAGLHPGNDRPRGDDPGRAVQRPQPLGHLKDKAAGYISDQPSNRNMKIDRADLLLAAMFHDSESTRTSDAVPGQRDAARPRPDRSARPRSADAGGPDQAARGSARARQPVEPSQDRPDHHAPHHPAAQARPQGRPAGGRRGPTRNVRAAGPMARR